MNKFFIPKRGDTVRVRLHSGEVVEATYLESGATRGNHFVAYGGSQYMACRHTGAPHLCRIIGPGAVMEERK